MARMSPPPSEVLKATSRRFFSAVAALVDAGRLPSLSAFCEEAGLSAPRYRALRLAYGLTPKEGYVCAYKGVELEAVAFLASHYPVSASWLLSGRGSMLTCRPS